MSSGPGGTGWRRLGDGSRVQHSPASRPPSTVLPKGAGDAEPRLRRCPCARRDALPPTPAPAWRVGFRSRVRGASSIVASLALEAEQGSEAARALGHVAYELARVAAGLAVRPA